MPAGLNVIFCVLEDAPLGSGINFFWRCNYIKYDQVRYTQLRYTLFRYTHQILLVSARNVDLWTIPGGGYEPGEKFEETALREAKEEVGMVSIVHGCSLGCVY